MIQERRRPRPKRIVLFAGTRPEAIKQAPIALAARGSADLEIALVHSGQHQRLFSDGLAPFGLVPDHRLEPGVVGADPNDMVTRIEAAFGPLLRELQPDMVVVQGDTSSALAGAITAHALRIPVAHVEAGLRSGHPDMPWPEEGNRRAIARLADVHFAPSARAAFNLMDEAVPGRIHVVGNTGIDALLHTRAAVTPKIAEAGQQEIVVTAHRRETIGAPLDRVATAVKAILADGHSRHATVLLHSNPAGEQLERALRGTGGLTLRQAVGYPEMVSLLAGADLVISDSGGLQEECPALGLPLIVLRDVTERPEVIEDGGALLVGTGVREIVDAARLLLGDTPERTAMCRQRFPYGRGDAAERIVDIIATYPFPLP